MECMHCKKNLQINRHYQGIKVLYKTSERNRNKRK